MGRQSTYGLKQLGYATKNGAEAAAHAVRNYISRTDLSTDDVMLKIDFNTVANASNTVRRDALLTTISGWPSPSLWGHPGGVEAELKLMESLYNHPDTEAILLPFLYGPLDDTTFSFRNHS